TPGDQGANIANLAAGSPYQAESGGSSLSALVEGRGQRGPGVRCASCGTENDQGRKFCMECGKPLARACPVCGSPNPPAAKYCGECASPLQDGPETTAIPSGAPTTERRIVSVLFADLVGFTTLSETRDSEEVRDLLSRYFEACRTVITRYGGTVE